MGTKVLEEAPSKAPALPRSAEVEAELAGSKIVVLSNEDLRWDVDPLDPGRRSAKLIGDQTVAGPFALRLSAPAGYVSALHTHPEADEQLTVLSGSIRWSTGEPGSGQPEYTLTAGGFALAPAGTPHRIEAIEDSVVQMQGIGPRTYVYLNPADDPRRNN